MRNVIKSDLPNAIETLHDEGFKAVVGETNTFKRVEDGYVYTAEITLQGRRALVEIDVEDGLSARERRERRLEQKWPRKL